MRFIDTSNKMPEYSNAEIKIKNKLDVETLKLEAINYFQN